ncbi:MDR/SDR family oxidoreductase [Aspergillus niger CBS 101883]|uniref:Enoyl reductase (ER) domain-containing protein n=1 Tax=Aspergillus niger ATCC 13496 TaxID=1353008 RepID=A0A370C340_ASPNG|nr:uncharacterized protein BO96DRAFT_478931 [Aspergillus niger CBS 101883]PYH61297.1 hypothetical protein BO96DRAFT_478931 [Aspergillus niger CBS 101883]RDH21469.1 hypothetical protein M747DRAFT_314176 [Aspergillus niger ATCC 13496]
MKNDVNVTLGHQSEYKPPVRGGPAEPCLSAGWLDKRDIPGALPTRWAGRKDKRRDGPYIGPEIHQIYRVLASLGLRPRIYGGKGLTTLADPSTDKKCIIFLRDQEGLVRSVTQELIINISILKVDPFEQDAADAIKRVVEKILRSQEAAHQYLDREFAFHDDTIYTSRCYWPLDGQNIPELKGYTLKKIHVGKAGLLDRLKWLESCEVGLHDDEVDVHLQYVGLVYLLYRVCAPQRRVGKHVSNLVASDEVSVVSPGVLRNHFVVDQKHCRKLFSRSLIRDAAGMALAYLTAIYSLDHVGHVQKDQTALIHSACGGVGLAAVQICKMHEPMYATVGTQLKGDYLVHDMGTPSSHIFDSRTTGGRGADIVSNSLAGPLLHASWACVAPFGKIIEPGKWNFLLNDMLTLYVIKRITELYNQGNIIPIRPVTLFEAHDIAEAFRMPDGSCQLSNSIIKRLVSFQPNASYLLVGGLGRLGRAVSILMIERGARHLVFSSRNAGVPESDKEIICEHEAAGCHVQFPRL